MEYHNDPAPHPYQFSNQPSSRNSPLLVGSLSVLILFTLGTAAYASNVWPFSLLPHAAQTTHSSMYPTFELSFFPQDVPPLQVSLQGSMVGTSTSALPVSLAKTISPLLTVQDVLTVGTSTYYVLFNASTSASTIYREHDTMLQPITSSATYKQHLSADSKTNTIVYEAITTKSMQKNEYPITITSLKTGAEQVVATGTYPILIDGVVYFKHAAGLYTTQGAGSAALLLSLGTTSPYAVSATQEIALFNGLTRSIDYFAQKKTGVSYERSEKVLVVPNFLVYSGKELFEFTVLPTEVHIQRAGSAQIYTIPLTTPGLAVANITSL